jgi:hypothetical protein
MDLTIRVVQNGQKPNVNLTVDENYTIGQLRQKMKEILLRPDDSCTLIFAGKYLSEDKDMLTKYGIKNKTALVAMFKEVKKVEEPIVKPNNLEPVIQQNLEENSDETDSSEEDNPEPINSRQRLLELMRDLPEEALQMLPNYNGNIESAVEAIPDEDVEQLCTILIELNDLKDEFEAEVGNFINQNVNNQNHQNHQNHHNHIHVVRVAMTPQDMANIREIQMMGFGSFNQIAQVYAQTGKDVNATIDVLSENL